MSRRILFTGVCMLWVAWVGGCSGEPSGSSASAVAPTPAARLEAPPNQWRLRCEQSPNTIWENGIAYDPDTRRVVFYGGHIGRLYPQSNYTFLYDLRQNRFFESQALFRPQRRCLVDVDYVDSRRRVITCNGGSGHGSIPQGSLGGDYKQVFKGDPRGPWLYDAVADAWEDCRTLPPIWQRRAQSPIAYEAGSDALACLGKDELMLFCPRTNRVHFRPLPEALKNRLGHGLAADPVHRKLVVFGGSGPGGWVWVKGDKAEVYEKYVHNDTWLFDIATGQWEEVKTAPRPPRGMPMESHLHFQMTYHDPSGTVLLLQNGVDRYERDNTKWGPAELWSFDVLSRRWTQLDVKNPPAFMGLLEYARQEDLLVLFGGGRDGIADNRQTVRPALSRHVYTCRLRIPGRQVAADPRPARIELDLKSSFTPPRPSPDVEVRWPAQRGAKYNVYRAGADPFPRRFEKINAKPITGGRFPDAKADLERGKVYAYQVEQIGAARRSLPAFSQPTRPSGLVASVESAARVALRWEVQRTPDTVRYRVYRADGPELAAGKRRPLTGADNLITKPQFVDEQVDLSDGVIRAYWVTAVNPLGIESGASPLAYTAPDAPRGLTVLEGMGPSNGVGVRLNWLLSWQWPKDVRVAEFNIYHATEIIDSNQHPGGHKAARAAWSKITETPVTGNEFVFRIPQDGPRHHYFHLRAVNRLGQEGFHTDIVSPTDRRFRP